MNVFITPSFITITCHKRIAPYLKQEVTELGYEVKDFFVTGVRLYGTVTDCIRLNLNLRCASQVLYSLQKFEAGNADEIYRQVTAYPGKRSFPKTFIFP